MCQKQINELTMKLQQSQSEASALKYQVINHHTQSHTLQYMQVSLYAHTHTHTVLYLFILFLGRRVGGAAERGERKEHQT